MQQFRQPDKAELIRKIEANIPLEILSDDIWIAYYFKTQENGKVTKPPMSSKGYTVKDGTPGSTFQQVCKDGYPGIKLSSSTDYIAFDIDDELAKKGKRKFSLELLSQEFKDFLKKYPTYTEISPSGCGLRVIARCSDKKSLNSTTGKFLLDQSKCIGGELFTHSGYVTITGNCVENPRKLVDLSPVNILKWVKSKVVDKSSKPGVQPNVLKVLGLAEFNNILDMCKLDQSDKIKRAYTSIMSDDYNHYDYWLKIMAACHDYGLRTGKMNEVREYVLRWSKTDPAAYQNDEDVLKHFESFSETDSGMTYKTLFKFSRLLKFDWPKPMIKKNVNTGKPMINENKNFLYLLEYYNIKFKLEILSNHFYVSADKSIMDNYFKLTSDKKMYFGMVGPYSKEEMHYKMWQIAQDNGYDNATSSTIRPLFQSSFFENCEQINIFEEWLNTEPKDIPFDLREPGTDIECSTLEYLISCIEFQPDQNMELVNKYLETFFFEMVMPIYNVRQLFAERSFMLILTGPENTRKSSFFKMLFPQQLQDTLMINSTEKLRDGKSLRDFKNLITRKCLVVVDEFDHFYDPKDDSLFKSLVTCASAPFVPIYQTEPVIIPRNAVLAGTTNETRLGYKQDSNRRFALLRVKHVDTDKMMKINWHHFYRGYVKRGSQAMMNNQFPWKPTDELIKLQYQENETNRAKTNLEQALLEVFDFAMDKHTKVRDLQTIKSVQTDKELSSYRSIEGALRQRFPYQNINIAELKRLLERLCGRYTSTTNKRIELPGNNSYIHNGICKQGQWTKYLMPPRNTDFDSE